MILCWASPHRLPDGHPVLGSNAVRQNLRNRENIFSAKKSDLIVEETPATSARSPDTRTDGRPGSSLPPSFNFHKILKKIYFVLMQAV